MDFVFWERCPKCGKQLVNESNLWKLRGIIGGSVVGGTIVGIAALPVLGFGAGGVAAGTEQNVLLFNSEFIDVARFEWFILTDNF